MNKLSLKNVRIIASIIIAVLSISLLVMVSVPEKTVTIIGKEGNSPIYNGPRNSDKVSLMFNVYEGTEVVLKILDVLDEFNAKSTFFVGGCWADDNNDALNEIVRRGHELANHGYFHLDHKKLSLEKNREEIETNHKLIKVITGCEMKLFAPPSGSFGKETLLACENLGYKPIMWTKDTIDWRDHDWKKVYDRAIKNINGGDLILMHPKKHTLEALDDVLNYYKQKGLRAVTVSECIKENDL